MKLVLASASKRRQQLLQRFGYDFQVCVADVSEVVQEESDCSAEQIAKENAYIKAKVIDKKVNDAIVIGADTIVVYQNKVLGKPKDIDDARQMLTLLSGKTHEVITGVALIGGVDTLVFHVKTYVSFRKLAFYEIENYVSTNEPYDKAGSYGIQGIGGVFVETIDGCYYNVVGLPIPRLVLELRKFGKDIF